MATAAIVVATAGLSGCGGNFNAQTDQIYQPAVGSNNREGQVYVLNALLVVGDGSDAALVAGLLDQAGTDDTLTAVTAKSSKGNDLTVTINNDQIPLPTRTLVRLSQDASVAISGQAGDLGPGGTVSVTFTFQNADPVTLDAPIVAREGAYADVPLPSPSPSASPSTAPPTPTQSP
jgi:copper(I)-binding protein